MEFTAAAEKYDRFMGRYTRTLAPVFVAAAGVRDGMSVLDIGCGPGGLTDSLTDTVGEQQVAAIDPAPQFVDACRARHPAADVREGVAEELPWADGSFDATLSCLVIGFMKDADRGVREMARVTRPGGTVAACMWDLPGGGMTMLSTFWKAAREVDPSAAGEQGRPGVKQGDIADRFRRAGLQDVKDGELEASAELRELRGLLGAAHLRGRPRRSVPRVAVCRATGPRPRRMPRSTPRGLVLPHRPSVVRARDRSRVSARTGVSVATGRSAGCSARCARA